MGGFPPNTDPPRYRHKLDKTVCCNALRHVKTSRGPWGAWGGGKRMATMGKKAFEFLALAVVLGVVPVVAGAQALTKDDVIAELQSEGFVVVDTGTTLLGRLRITATGPEGTREVILNTRNGKVLRDVMIEEAPEIPVEITNTAVVAPVVTEPLPPVVVPPVGGDAGAHGAGAEAAVPDRLTVDDEAEPNLP